MTNLTLVFKQDAANVLMTDSRRLAEGFGARHADILRKIEAILSETEDKFNERNFALVEYLDAKGENRPMYQMTRDGFMFIARTFTGRKGNEFAIKVINTFNQMEMELAKRNVNLPFDPNNKMSVLKYCMAAVEEEQAKTLVAEAKVQLLTEELSTSKIGIGHVTSIQNEINNRRHRENLNVKVQGKMYTLIKSHFGIPSIGTFKDLELRDYDAVIQFIREVPLPRAWYTTYRYAAK